MKVNSILVSQPEPKSDSSPYHRLSEKYGVQIDFRSFIHVEGLEAAEIRKQKIDLTLFPNIIMTSRNAIDHYFRIAEEMRFKVPDTTKYFCISEAVANYLQKYIVYRKRKIYVGKNSISDCIPLMKKFSKEQFLLPCSDALNPKYEQILNDSKFSWQKAVMYHTVHTDLSDLQDVNYDMLVFYSPSGIESLYTNFPDFKQNDTLIAVFGPSTIKAAEKKGLNINLKVPSEEFPSMSVALKKTVRDREVIPFHIPSVKLVTSIACTSLEMLE